jgi:hypothetical protein
MADSLLDIGTEEVFPLEPNWATKPGHTYTMTRYLNQHPGTVTEISQKNPESPWVVTARFDIQSKEEEFELLSFIKDREGRVGKFWFKHPKNMFSIKDALSNGSTQVIVYEDNFHLISQGYERIYIELLTGDIITRHVSSADWDEDNEEVQLNLATGVDRDIAVDEVLRIGRFLLVRFDDDMFRFDLDTDHKSMIRLRFKELVKEYSDLAPNP